MSNIYCKSMLAMRTCLPNTRKFKINLWLHKLSRLSKSVHKNYEEAPSTTTTTRSCGQSSDCGQTANGLGTRPSPPRHVRALLDCKLAPPNERQTNEWKISCRSSADEGRRGTDAVIWRRHCKPVSPVVRRTVSPLNVGVCRPSGEKNGGVR